MARTVTDFVRYTAAQPPSTPPRPQRVGVYVKLDTTVVDWFHQAGPGYQARINEVLGQFVHGVTDPEHSRSMAGGTLVHQGDATPRDCNDIDLIHDPAASVIACAAVDIATLEAHGYRVNRLLDGRSLIRAMVERDAFSVLID